MAKRYRNFKRLCMSAPVAKVIEAKLVDLTFTEHYQKCFDRGKERAGCYHSLDVARMVAPALKIGARRATLDLPDDPELVRKFVDRLRGFIQNATDTEVKKHRVALAILADEAFAWATRSPLHRLAEAGLELDDAGA